MLEALVYSLPNDVIILLVIRRFELYLLLLSLEHARHLLPLRGK